MLSVPLRNLVPQDIEAYALSAFYTTGSASDWRYFLPRMLELAVLTGGDSYSLCPEIILSKLPLAGWEGWHKSERTAIMDFIDAWYDGVISEVPADGMKIDALLCGIACAGISLKPYLEKLAGNLEALVAYCEEQSGFVEREKGLRNASWSDAPEGAAEVWRFLTTGPAAGLI